MQTPVEYDRHEIETVVNTLPLKTADHTRIYKAN